MKSFLLSLVPVLIGCGTPSDVQLGERRFNRLNADGDEVPAVVTEGRYFYTDPMTTMAAQGQMLWNFEMAKALEAVRTATNDGELEFAKKQLAAVQSAKPAGPEKVQGQIINYTNMDLICVVYADVGKTKRLGRVILPPAPDAGGSIRPFTVVKGTNAHFVFTQGSGEFVNQYTLENPASEGWQAHIK